MNENDRMKDEIKRKIKANTLAALAGSATGYVGGATLGAGMGKAKYLKDRREYIKKKAKGRPLDKAAKKKIIAQFDRQKVPVRKIFPDSKVRKIRPRKDIYKANMVAEGARMGVTGMVKGIPYGIMLYSVYDTANKKLKNNERRGNNGN